MMTMYPELENLLPSLTEMEKAELKKSILSEGCEEPIVIWNNSSNSIIVDGYQRYAICEEYDISYEVKEINFGCLEAAIEYRLRVNFFHRHMTREQLSYYRGMQHELTRFRAMTDRDGSVSKHSRDYVAELHGVSSRTIQNDVYYYNGIERIAKPNTSP